jgi:putative transposase
MKLTIAVQLRPTPEQASALRETLARANAACNRISAAGWDAQTFGQFRLHKLTYAAVRAASGLSAQVVVRCIAKVADAYKRDTRRQRVFKPRGAIAYDDRILRWYAAEVSIWTIAGRERIPFVCGPRERALLAARQGESDLVLREGRWYLYTTVNSEELPIGEPVDVLGADFGIVNILADSDGTTYSGAQLNGLRARHRRLRAAPNACFASVGARNGASEATSITPSPSASSPRRKAPGALSPWKSWAVSATG